MVKSLKTNKIIAIIGLMGVGKTTLGSKLAEKLGYYFVDSDLEIEDSAQKTIGQIFADEGEKYFRDLEKKAIKDIIARDEAMVLSLGGGAFMDEEVQKILQEKAIIIWLNASIDVILHRLGNKTNRPLLNNANKRQVLEDLARQRFPFYKMADIEIDTSNGGYEALIGKIINLIK